MTDGLCQQSLTEIADAIRTRKVSALEVTRACLDRAERLQATFNCFIAIDRGGAEKAARAADAKLASGAAVGPMHGVPVAHKDMFYRRGRVSTCGSKLRQDFTPDYTATALDRLDGAGAIEIGTLNMSEFACNPFGLNVLVGRAKNPWNPDYIAGGSSSGSAAAVRAGLVYGSLGSDTGGSVRLPAAICGVAGLLPTNSRISRYGVMPLSFSMDNAGPLARTVRDCARMLSVVAGADALDPTSSDTPIADYERGIDAPLRGRRIGVARRHFHEGLSPDLQRLTDDSIAVLKALGASVIDVELPDPRPMDALGNIIILSEAAAIHQRGLRERGADYTPLVRARIEYGMSFPAAKYIEALSLRAPLLAKLDGVFAQVDAIHVPMLPQPVPATADVEAQLAGKADLSFNLACNTRWVNYLGLPSLSVPCGFSANGLPVAFQLVGAPFAEATLFNIGHQYQQQTPHHLAWPERLTAAETVS
jgi:aspartyl-tRNA(Asn)/glutamyl-tRNA(Gln) amidotransferase subunit A